MQRLPHVIAACCLGVLVWGVFAQAGELRPNSKDIKSEFGFFVMDFLTTPGEKLPDWSFNGDNPRVAWAGAPNETDDAMKRSGTCYVTAAGKRYVMDGRDLPWMIEATGTATGGVERISFEPHSDAFDREDGPGCDIPFPDAVTVCPATRLEYLCSRVETPGGDQEDYYLMTAGDRANVLSFASTWGSGGYFDTVILHYDLPPYKDKAKHILGEVCNRSTPLETH